MLVNQNARLFLVWFALCAAVTILVALLDVFIVDGNAVWGPANSASYDKNGVPSDFCEDVHLDQFVRARMDSYSSLAFIFAGFAVAVIACSSEKSSGVNHLRIDHPELSILQALTLIWGGFGSFWAHASLNNAGDSADRASVWSLVIFPLSYSILCYFRCPASKKTYTYFSLFVIFWDVIACIGHGCWNNYPVAGVFIYAAIPTCAAFIVVIIFLRRAFMGRFGVQNISTNWKGLVAAVVCALVAVLFQFPQRVGACDADGDGATRWYMHTHAYWHILMALALFLLWRVLWNEEFVVDKEKEDGLLQFAG